MVGNTQGREHTTANYTGCGKKVTAGVLADFSETT